MEWQIKENRGIRLKRRNNIRSIEWCKVNKKGRHEQITKKNMRKNKKDKTVKNTFKQKTNEVNKSEIQNIRLRKKKSKEKKEKNIRDRI